MPDRTIAPVPQWRQAVVSAVAAGPPSTVTLTLDGAAVGPIRHLDSYVPAVDDVVWCVRNDSDLVVLGRLAESAAGSGVARLATTVQTANSATIGTTETSVGSVVADVVVGRVYRVTYTGASSGRALATTHGCGYARTQCPGRCCRSSRSTVWPSASGFR